MTLRTSVAALYGACLVLGVCPEDSRAATATDLVTICMSATTTIQASKCTAWQYNVYSPTAYIESYPTVTPAETGINDPNYEYRLGSSLTPAIGVKVCPAAQTPGTSFASTSADPCPSNKLVAASTILPTYSYAIMVSPGIPTSYIPTYPVGFQVLQTNTSGSSFVAGGPFVPSPVPTGAGGSLDTVPGPSLAVLDPTGQYLYALYDTGFATAEILYSFRWSMESLIKYQVLDISVAAAVVATLVHMR